MAQSEISSENSLAHWRGAFERYLKSEKRASAYTLRNYAATLSRFEVFLNGHLGGSATLNDLSRLETRDFRAYLAARRNEGLGPPSLKLELSALKTFYKFLGKRADVENDAISAMRGPKAKERLPRPVTETDADALIDAAATMKTSTRKKTWEQARDAAPAGVRVPRGDVRGLAQQSGRHSASAASFFHGAVVRPAPPPKPPPPPPRPEAPTAESLGRLALAAESGNLACGSTVGRSSAKADASMRRKLRKVEYELWRETERRQLAERALHVARERAPYR